ncbi:hypothetical protein [Nostoc sp.]|uniref:hypothetical protein n=1 Tax=Nostoc sp. TaxID=1180 RepID=UPI002FFA6660
MSTTGYAYALFNEPPTLIKKSDRSNSSHSNTVTICCKYAKIFVQVIMLVEPPSEEDETTYLLKSETNKKHLIKALENVEKGNLIFCNLDEYEKIIF